MSVLNGVIPVSVLAVSHEAFKDTVVVNGLPLLVTWSACAAGVEPPSTYEN
jgi:hypothetical protein